MIDIDTLIRIVDEGSTPLILVLAYFMYRIWQTLSAFITEVKALAEVRDKKLDKIGSNVDAVIKRLAGIKNEGNE